MYCMSRYEIMYSCWRTDPLDRPSFPQLCEMLEKLTEKLPESFSKDDIIYINTSFPEEDPDGETLPAELPVFSSSPSCSHQAVEHSVVTVDIHGSLEDEEDGSDDRYVVVVSNPAVRAPAAAAPLLPSVAFSQDNGNIVMDAAGMDHGSSDTSCLLWWKQTRADKLIILWTVISPPPVLKSMLKCKYRNVHLYNDFGLVWGLINAAFIVCQ